MISTLNPDILEETSEQATEEIITTTPKIEDQSSHSVPGKAIITTPEAENEPTTLQERIITTPESDLSMASTAANPKFVVTTPERESNNSTDPSISETLETGGNSTSSPAADNSESSSKCNQSYSLVPLLFSCWLIAH